MKKSAIENINFYVLCISNLAYNRIMIAKHCKYCTKLELISDFYHVYRQYIIVSMFLNLNIVKFIHGDLRIFVFDKWIVLF